MFACGSEHLLGGMFYKTNFKCVNVILCIKVFFFFANKCLIFTIPKMVLELVASELSKLISLSEYKKKVVPHGPIFPL